MAKILVIEDDKGTREIYSSVLKQAGYEVDVAEDGGIGFSKAKEGGYDLVLLDVMLPKMDGIAILGELKKSPPKTPNKNIYLLTNLSHDPILKEGVGLGAKDYILKTDINPGQLTEKVKKILAI